MKAIPTQKENPKGLHQRFTIKKIIRNPDYILNNPVSNPGIQEFIEVDVPDNAEYFVMRLDEGGKDIEHIKACRIGVNAYADAIKHHLPDLAADLKQRYPIL